MIRKLTKEDLTKVIAIENECFHSPYKLDQFEYELDENPFSKLFVLEIDGEIVGYIDYWITFEVVQLCKIAIALKHQGKHYADMLMQHMHIDGKLEGGETLSLEVRVSNHKAISLYEKYGYTKASLRKNYYDDGEDAYLMIKEL